MWNASRIRHLVVAVTTGRRRPLLAAYVLVLLVSSTEVRSPRFAVAADCDPGTMPSVQAAELAVRLHAGEPVFLSCVRVSGRIELRPGADDVGPLFVIDSTLEGGLAADFVRFGGAVHFDGSCFQGDLDLAGAVFEDEVNWARADFDCGPRAARVRAPGSRFHAPADLRAARYSTVDFTDASFGARTLLQGADFGSDATFRGALFGDETSFRAAVFSAFANFENVTALADLDMSSSRFFADALFRRFSGSGKLSLRDASFGRDFILDRTSAASIDLSRATFRGPIHMSDVSATSLQMSPAAVGAIEERDVRMDVLRTIERSAKAQDDTALANSAVFQRQSLETRAKPQPQRTFWLGVEVVTGYLVRPLRPLVAIGVVALAGLTVRLALDGRTLAASVRRAFRVRAIRTSLVESHNREARRRSSWHVVAVLADPAGRAMTAAIDPRPPQPAIEESDGSTYAVATLVWLEYLVQKSLVAAFLISLGNANPTIREIITSIL